MATVNTSTFEFKNPIPYYKMFPKLSAREVEVLVLSVFGFSRTEIALNLNVSINTVNSYFKNAIAKYELNTASELKRLFFCKLIDSLATALWQ